MIITILWSVLWAPACAYLSVHFISSLSWVCQETTNFGWDNSYLLIVTHCTLTGVISHCLNNDVLLAPDKEFLAGTHVLLLK